MRQVISSLHTACQNAFLFTKSDIKTTLIPISIFAYAAVAEARPSDLPHVIFWVWLHLLQFNVSNQSIESSATEDAINQPDRPLADQRISLKKARVLRWALVLVCLVWSALYSWNAILATILLCSLTVVYNECGAGGQWFARGIVNGVGLGSFQLGASIVLSPDRRSISTSTLWAIATSAAIFATTIQAQDFKDTEGDEAIGRTTLPIKYPRLSRYLQLPFLLAWSIYISIAQGQDTTTAIMTCSLALLVGVRFWAYTDRAADRTTYIWYNVWVAVALTFVARSSRSLSGR